MGAVKSTTKSCFGTNRRPVLVRSAIHLPAFLAACWLASPGQAAGPVPPPHIAMPVFPNPDIKICSPVPPPVLTDQDRNKHLTAPDPAIIADTMQRVAAANPQILCK